MLGEGTTRISVAGILEATFLDGAEGTLERVRYSFGGTDVLDVGRLIESVDSRRPRLRFANCGNGE